MINKGFHFLIFQLQFYMTSFRQNSTIRIKHFNLKKAMDLTSGFLIKLLLSIVFVHLFFIVSLYKYVGKLTTCIDVFSVVETHVSATNYYLF